MAGKHRARSGSSSVRGGRHRADKSWSPTAHYGAGGKAGGRHRKRGK